MKSITLASTLAVMVGVTGSALAYGGPGSGVVVLHPSVNGALSLTGNSKITVPTRGVFVNSSHGQAVRTSGAAILETPHLSVVGGVSLNSQSMVDGDVFTGQNPIDDPLASFNGVTGFGTIHYEKLTINGGSHELSPGTYSGGIEIAGNANVTLISGVYRIGGTGFTFNSGTLTGDGVTLYVENGAFKLAGNSTINLSPPMNGETAHITIAQSPVNTTQMDLAGGADVFITGAIYAPGAHMLMVGSSTIEGEGPLMGDLVVARTLELRGTAVIRVGREGTQAIVPQRMPLSD